MGNGTVQDAVTDRSGITGEKMELDGYMTEEGVCTAVYNHMNRNGLCAIVAFNKEVNEQLAKQIAMQIAAMNPIAIDEDGVSEEVKQKEIEVAIEKTKAEQVQKAVEAALKKANFFQELAQTTFRNVLNHLFRQVCSLLCRLLP